MLASARVWVAALAASLRRCRAGMFMGDAASLVRRVGVMQVRERVASFASSRGCDASLRTRA